MKSERGTPHVHRAFRQAALALPQGAGAAALEEVAMKIGHWALFAVVFTVLLLTTLLRWEDPRRERVY